MQKEQFYKILSSPSKGSEQSTNQLEGLIKDFPYFQTARLMYAKQLYDQDSIRYEAELRKTAAYAGNRSILHKLIHGTVLPSDTTVVIHESTPTNRELTGQSQESDSLQNKHTVKPIDYSAIDTAGARTFLEWLNVGREGSYEQGILNDKQKAQFNLIDSFINVDKTEGEQKPAEFFSASKMGQKSLLENSDTISETLAIVYEQQGNFEKALKAYEQLTLKYPKKSSYFASRINDIMEKKERGGDN